MMFQKIDSNGDGKFTYDDFIRSAGHKSHIQNETGIHHKAMQTARQPDL